MRFVSYHNIKNAAAKSALRELLRRLRNSAVKRKDAMIQARTADGDKPVI